MVYKLGKSHSMANALSGLSNGVLATGVHDQIVDARLFYVLSEWLQDIGTYFKIEKAPLSMLKDEQLKLILKALPYTLKNGVLYRRC